MISFVSARNYLFKVNKLSARIRCESSSILRMSMSTIFNINDYVRSGVIIVNFKHISNYFPVVDFEQANICLFHIEKANLVEDKIGRIMGYVLF